MTTPVAVITGASAGIGAATAARLRAEGFDVVVGARRLDKLEEVAAAIGARPLPLDVCDAESVARFAEEVGPCQVLVNNAGGALGLEPIAQAVDEHWRWMYDANVLGTMRMTRALLPRLIESGAGHIVNIGSIAGLEVYDNGGGYTAAKHALRALTETLRIELIGQPVRITEVDPGFVETEFSLVRFSGDVDRAKQPYVGMTPLCAEDVADCIAFVVTRPAHVNIDQVVVKPLAQATAMRVHRVTD
ncbi:MAG TPA: SDR family NAD(P)-dependent oxidoreductase [Acidimicrobiales bacterium]|nr:SDR family NAD(P)-dependent oxidoreductase [Acidimicrobiales bacterium]